MALPHRALVLVADGTKVLFLRNHGDQNQIDLRNESHDQREDRKDRKIKRTPPGRRQCVARPAGLKCIPRPIRNGLFPQEEKPLGKGPPPKT